MLFGTLALLLPILVIVLIVASFRFKSDVLSLASLREGMIEAWKRFPLTVLYSTAAAVIAAGAFITKWDDWASARLVCLCALGISLSFAGYLFAGARETSRLTVQAVTLAALVLFGAMTWNDTNWVFVMRFVQMCLFSHLLVSFCAFRSKEDTDAFWSFNSLMLVRFLFALSFAAILWGFVSILFLAVSYLFEIKIKGEPFGITWSICAFFVSALIFLAGIPRDPRQSDHQERIVYGLSILVQFLLLPFALLYIMVLYLYAGKIIFVAAMPKNLVGWLVCGVAIMGTFTWLLSYPLREKGNALVRFFYRAYFFLVLPLLALLFFALYQRLEQYGMTERRYFLGVLAVWLSIIALYFSLLRGRDLRVIPASLCFLSIAALFGPWSAYSVSVRSQLARLERTINSLGGLPIKPEVRPSKDDSHGISESLRYLTETHGPETYEHLFSGVPAAMNVFAERKKETGARYRYSSYELLQKLLPAAGLEYVPYRQLGNQAYFYLNPSYSQDAEEISGYDYYFRAVPLNPHPQEKIIPGSPTRLRVSLEKNVLKIQYGNETKSVDLAPFIETMLDGKRVSSSQQIDRKKMIVPVELDSLKVRFFFQSITGKDNGKTLELDSANAELLVSEVKR